MHKTLLVCLLTLPTLGLSQSVTSAIAGTVLDPLGAPVESAAVQLTDLETQAVQRTSTTGAGVFRLGGLRPGTYELVVEKTGFQAYRLSEWRVLAAQDLSRTVTLQVAQAQAQVTVVAQASEIENVAANGTRGGTFTPAEVNDLPLIAGGQGRSFRVQAFQLPGVASQGTAHAPFNVNGNRSQGAMNVMVDGAEFNDTNAGRLLGAGNTEQPVSMEAVESMEVQTSNFKAEYGRATGTVINLVTKRGTNAWHGSLYEYYQNASLNARNAALAERPPLTSHTPGATVGGPLRRDRLFLYAGVEATVRNTFSTSSTIPTLTDAQRAQAVPAVRPLVDLFPRPNAGTNLQSATVPNPRTVHVGLLKVDWTASDRHRAGFRSNYNRQLGYNYGRLPALDFDSTNGNQSHVATLDSSLTSRTLNQAKFAYTYYRSDVRPQNYFLGDPAVNGEVGGVLVTGLQSLSSVFRYPRRTRSHAYVASNDLSHSVGRHNLKAGVIVRLLQSNGNVDQDFNGRLTFATIPDFLAGRALSYTRSVGDSRLDMRGRELGLYLQDDWKVSPNLTLNAGLRHEYYAPYREKYDRLPQLYGADRNNLSPRFGFSYNVRGRNTTVVRGGYGLFYQPLLLDFVNDTRFAPPLVRTFTRAAPVVPNLLDETATVGSNVTLVDRTIVNPYVQNWNLTVERQVLNPDTVASIGYVGTRGVRLARTRRPNFGDALARGVARPDPARGVVNLLETSASSTYHGLQASFRTLLRGGLTLRAAYTHSAAIDDASTYSGFFPVDERNLRLDRGRSDFDQPHVLSASAIYPLPFLRGRTGMLGLLGGWQMAGTFTYRSALPFSILSNTVGPQWTQNNRALNVPGALLRQASGSQFLRLAPGFSAAQLQPAVGTVGTLGRNTERGDSFRDVSASLQKQFAVTERLRAEFRAEAFNLTNAVNWGSPTNNVASPVFGRALAAADARQVQLAFRVTY